MAIENVTVSGLHEKPPRVQFKKNDVLVLFGELFQRGYANGLVEEAEKCGLKVIYATVGRRTTDLELRPLNEEELASKASQTPLINIPLEAGFDLEQDSSGQRPIDYLKSVKLSDWNSVSIPEKTLHECREKGRQRFRKMTQNFLSEIEKFLPENGHVHFAHLMAGGVPRTKLVMPLMNRVFKGTGDRHLASTEFWNSNIGQFLSMNFDEVTAETFNILIDESTTLRNHLKTKNTTVSYVAYGYHGTEVIIDGKYKWQSYAPYLQGWAKMKLEDYAIEWSQKGVQCCVYNCPEILTNSSSIFQGVEIPLYNLMRAIEKENPTHSMTIALKKQCQDLLNHPEDLNVIYQKIDNFLKYSEEIGTSRYENWPQHSNKEQLETTLNLSDEVIALHKDPQQMMTAVLSEVIFKSCGYLMLHDGVKPKNPVSWVGHDVVARCMIP